MGNHIVLLFQELVWTCKFFKKVKVSLDKVALAISLFGKTLSSKVMLFQTEIETVRLPILIASLIHMITYFLVEFP